MRDPNKGLKTDTYKTKIERAADGWCPKCMEMNCICPVSYQPMIKATNCTPDISKGERARMESAHKNGSYHDRAEE